MWETDLDVPARHLAVAQKHPVGASKLLLDGQQRLTSLSAVLRGEPLRFKNRVRPVEIAFNLEHPEGPPVDVEEVEEDTLQLNGGPSADNGGESADDEESTDDATSEVASVQERARNLTFVVASRALLADKRWVKVSDVFNPEMTDWQLLKPLGLTPDDAAYDRYTRRLQRARQIRQYQYVMQVLERDLSYEEVTEIFVRVNSLGMKLRGSDLAFAQITGEVAELA